MICLEVIRLTSKQQSWAMTSRLSILHPAVLNYSTLCTKLLMSFLSLWQPAREVAFV